MEAEWLAEASIEVIESLQPKKITRGERIHRIPKIHLVDQMMTDPPNFRRLTRFTCSEFNQIASELERAFPICTTTLDTRTKLFYFLNRMSGGVFHTEGVAKLGMCEATASNYFNEMLSKVVKLYKGVISWPTAEARKKLGAQVPDLPGCIGAIDGTHLRICKPFVNESMFYSGKHRMHSINCELVCM